MNKAKKVLAVLSTSALLSGVPAAVLPLATPALANSKNAVQSVPSISSDYNSFANPAAPTPVNYLYLKEDLTPFTPTDTFRLILPSGVKWSDYASLPAGAPQPTNATVNKISDQVLEVESTVTDGATETNDGDQITIPLYIKVDGAKGPIDLTVDPLDSTVTGGKYTIATVGSGNTVAVVDDPKTIALGSTTTAGTIRIDETAINSLGENVTGHKIRLKLPSKFKWDSSMSTADVTFAGGLANPVGTVTNVVVVSGDERTLEITYNIAAGTRSQRGSIYITPKIVAEDDAPAGDVVVNISGASGSKVSDADVVIGTAATYGVTVKVDSVKELLAGKMDDIKTDKITIEENVRGSIIKNRNITVELPSWVKVTGISDWKGSDFTAAQPTPDGTKNKITITPTTDTSTGTKGKISFKLQLSIEGDQSGDIKARVYGGGVPEQEVTIAKAVAPVTAAAVKPADVKIGVQNQDAPDIVLSETVKGAWEKRYETNPSGTTSYDDGSIWIMLPDGVRFAGTPNVEVVDGNVEIDKDNVKVDPLDQRYLEIPIKSESTKPSQIKISGIKITVDRTVPEGPIKVKVGGPGVVENYHDPATASGEFKVDYATTFVLANTVTPAPGQTKNVAVFKIGDTSFTVNGKTLTMEAAPYIKNDRTLLPVRYVALALGIPESNIIWGSDYTVTIISGSKVVKLTIGSNVMVVNGTAITMDTTPEIKNDRTFLPISWLSKALDAKISYDGNTGQVTVESAQQ